MHEVFLTEVFYRKVESNRIDFPKQIRIKRKYLNKLMTKVVRRKSSLEGHTADA